MTELLPCPFCGGKALLSKINLYPKHTQIACNLCLTQTAVYASEDIKDSEEICIINWNTRVKPLISSDIVSSTWRDGYQAAIDKMMEFLTGEENEKKN